MYAKSQEMSGANREESEEEMEEPAEEEVDQANDNRQWLEDGEELPENNGSLELEEELEEFREEESQHLQQFPDRESDGLDNRAKVAAWIYGQWLWKP